MRKYSCLGAIMALTLLSGCFDDKYDLSDIDDTVGIEVKDLVVPVNLETVEFSSVVDLENEEGLEVNSEGQYVIRKGGSFSENVHINSIVANPHVDMASQTVTLPTVPGVTANVVPTPFDFSYSGNGSQYIVELEAGETSVDMTVTVNLSAAAVLQDVAFQLPEGLYGYYDTQAGRKYITNDSEPEMFFPGEAKATAAGRYDFLYHVTSFDAIKAQVDYSPDHFAYRGSIILKSGKVTTQASNLTLKLGLELSTLEVTSITGYIVYNFGEFEHQEVNLGDLPEVLKDPETNISLINPQLYITLNNPLYAYNLHGSTGLKVTQQRPAGQYAEMAELADRISIGTNSGRQHFLVCPEPNAVEPISGYDDAALERYAMPGLGRILAGRGLPSDLDIEFVSPRVDRGHVSDFRLGVDVGTLVGDYTFYAPLAFGAGSQVIYKGESHGWGFGDDEDFEITSLSATAHLNSDLPVNLTLTAEPIDEYGNVIKHNGNDVTVTVEPAVIPANADCDITIHISGSIRHLDGLRYTAKIAADQDASALRPDMGLNLTNLRAKVSGKYVSNSK